MLGDFNLDKNRKDVVVKLLVGKAHANCVTHSTALPVDDLEICRPESEEVFLKFREEFHPVWHIREIECRDEKHKRANNNYHNLPVWRSEDVSTSFCEGEVSRMSYCTYLSVQDQDSCLLPVADPSVICDFECVRHIEAVLILLEISAECKRRSNNVPVREGKLLAGAE